MSDHCQNKYDEIYMLPTFCQLQKPMEQTNSNAHLKSYIIKYKTPCKIPEVNWLKIGDVVRVSKIDHQFFSRRRPGTNATGSQKRTFVNTGMRDQTAQVERE